jgi:hypothetical protein
MMGSFSVVLVLLEQDSKYSAHHQSIGVMIRRMGQFPKYTSHNQLSCPPWTKAPHHMMGSFSIVLVPPEQNRDPSRRKAACSLRPITAPPILKMRSAAAPGVILLTEMVPIGTISVSVVPRHHFSHQPSGVRYRSSERNPVVAASKPSGTTPVGPLRCLAIWTSTVPFFALAGS